MICEVDFDDEPGDNQVAVVDVDGGPEGGKSRDFF